jgi:hypothetical protein
MFEVLTAGIAFELVLSVTASIPRQLTTAGLCLVGSVCWLRLKFPGGSDHRLVSCTSKRTTEASRLASALLPFIEDTGRHTKELSLLLEVLEEP